VDEIHCASTDELAEVISKLAPGMLFRGQTREYLRADGGPDLRSSIDRHGCIPDRMLKWWQYSRFILGTYIHAFDEQSDLATDQAILQHYGWRSFFLDASSSAQVACWFAGHAYTTKRSGELVEDCWEDPVIVRRSEARYEDAVSQTGCLYVIGRKGLRRNEIGCVDLVEIATKDGQHRCSAQSAFMVGPLTGNLPDDCVVAKIFASTEVFRSYATQDPSLNQSFLFPDRTADPFLAALLSLPWIKINTGSDDGGIDFFERGLSLPEYNIASMKRNSPDVCFYRRYWLADAVQEKTTFAETDFYLTGEGLFHGTSHTLSTFPNITRLLKTSPSVAVEIDGLVRYPYAGSGAYAKGIYFELQDDGSILLTELAVEQFGLRPSGFGLTRGTYFTSSTAGVWVRTAHPEECDCGNEAHHKQHLVVASHFEHMLAEGVFKNLRSHAFAAPDVDTKSDQGALSWLKI
jgi:hypothetical protein